MQGQDESPCSPLNANPDIGPMVRPRREDFRSQRVGKLIDGSSLLLCWGAVVGGNKENPDSGIACRILSEFEIDPLEPVRQFVGVPVDDLLDDPTVFLGRGTSSYLRASHSREPCYARISWRWKRM